MKKSWFVVLFLMLIQGSLFYYFMPHAYTTSTSYFYQRHIEDLVQTKHFSFYDPLSYEGRYIPLPPFFLVVMAIFQWFGAFPLQYLTPFFLLLLIPLSYVLLFFLTKNEVSSLVTASLVATLPILAQWYAVLDPFLLVLVFLLLQIFLFFQTKQRKRFEFLYILTFIAFTLTSPFVFLYVGVLFVYFLLLRLQEKPLTQKELELFFFSLFFSVWFYLILYKKILFENGLSALWRNIPSFVFSSYFSTLSFGGLVTALGIVLYLVGLYAFYRVLLRPSRKELLLFPSLLLVTVLGLFARWLLPREGFTLIGISFALLVGSYWKTLFSVAKQLKFSSLTPWFMALLFLLLFVTNIFSLIQQVPQQTPVITSRHLALFSWLKDHTPPDSVIAAPYELGHLITYFSRRKVIADDFFFGVDHSSLVLASLHELYQTPFVTEALSILNRYHASYLVVPPPFSLNKTLEYLSDTRCFQPVYSFDHWEVYAIRCQLTTS